MSAQQQRSAAQEQQRKKESADAARKALEAERKAHELTQAAAAAGDPDVRQKLLNEALEKEVEAETFGKTAKYLNSGAFQGLCAGAGLGGGIGIWLGVLTGTLVGGTTGVVTGSLGGGLGATIGYAHGPWFSVGKMMGEGIRKITGDIPGWKATDEQKSALEKMINGVKDQERPLEDELVVMSNGGTVVAGKGYTGQREADEGEKGLLQGAKPSMPYIPGVTSKKKTKDRPTHSKVEQEQPTKNVVAAKRMERHYEDLAGEGVPSNAAEASENPVSDVRKRPNKISRTKSQRHAPTEVTTGPTFPSRRSARIQQQAGDFSVGMGHVPIGEKKYSSAQVPPKPKKKPRKLEIRSNGSG